MNSELRSLSQDVLRRETLARVLNFSTEVREEKSRSICHHLTQWFQELRSHRAVKSVGVFSAMKSEPQLESFLQTLRTSSVQICYPRVSGNDLSFYVTENLVKSNMGFLEPDLSQGDLKPVVPEVVLVPGVVFHADGLRIGRGRGFYDRYLSQCQVLKCGVCFFEQIHSDSWNETSTDQRMDMIVTDRALFACVH